MSSGGGITSEGSAKLPTVMHRDKEDDNIGSEMQRILRLAGIESVKMDPSSAKCLRELITVELEKKEAKGDVDEQQIKTESASNYHSEAITPAETTPANIVAPHINSSTDDTKKSTTKVSALSEPSPTRDSSLPSTKSSTPPVISKPTPAPKSFVDSTKSPIPATPSLEILSMLLDPNPDDVTSSFNASNTKDESETIPSAPLRKLLRSQQKTLEDQSKAIKLLTANIQELTNTVHTLQQSLERLEGSQAPQHQSMKTSAMPNIDDRDSNATDNTPDANTNANANQFHNNNNNNNNNIRQENPNDFQRAHMLAHHVAWRIATFPLRAVFFYLKYEYRIWLVMYRLARREVLNPFREAGMMFQLGFALIIVYGRIAPAIENAVNKRRREQQQEGGGDDDYYDEAFLEDAEFQIQTIVTAILVGFLYHVGVFGLVYRFFFRDRLHIRIWKDLREGVELTPTYGLDFEREVPPETGGNENENQNNNDRNNDNNNDQAARNNNNANDNNIPRPPNRNHNRGHVNDDGPLFEMANAIGNGVNDFFMGHGRRRRAVQEQVEAAAEAHNPPQPAADGDGDGDVNPIPNHRNPVLGLISDLLCLLYSFFVSILPGWNYEQQLRDMRDEEDMRLRAIMEREAEALRNQNVDGSDESESDSEDEDEDGM